MKFKRKTIIIEATQWFKNGDHPEDGDSNKEGKVVRYFNNPQYNFKSHCSLCNCSMQGHGWIDNPESNYRVCPEDWIITPVNGEHYPCKPDIFKEKYELVEE